MISSPNTKESTAKDQPIAQLPDLLVAQENERLREKINRLKEALEVEKKGRADDKANHEKQLFNAKQLQDVDKKHLEKQVEELNKTVSVLTSDLDIAQGKSKTLRNYANTQETVILLHENKIERLKNEASLHKLEADWKDRNYRKLEEELKKKKAENERCKRGSLKSTADSPLQISEATVASVFDTPRTVGTGKRGILAPLKTNDEKRKRNSFGQYVNATDLSASTS